MAAVLVEVADAVAEALNGHDFGVVFTAERSYANWNDEFKDLGDIKVDVVPDNDNPNMTDDDADRGELIFPCTVDVMIRKRLDQFEQEQDTGRPALIVVDPLMAFVEDAFEFLSFRQHATLPRTGELTLASGRVAAWDPQTTRMVAHYIRGRLRQNLFIGLFRVGYRVGEE